MGVSQLFYKRGRNNARKRNSATMNVRAPKTAKQMERHLKGVANHRRIEILLVVAEQEGITVEGLAENLRCNYNTLSIHIQRLVQAGLINKKYQGRSVAHSLSPYGKMFVSFLTTFQHS